MSSRPSRLRSNKILSFCCRCCSSISSLFHFSFLWVGDLQSRLSSLRYSSSSRDVACCWKSSTVGPINEDCSHTLPRVRRSWNTKGHDYSQYFNMLAERIPAILGAFEKWRKTTISFVMSVCSSVRMEQLGSHWMDFSKIWYLIIFRKSVEKIQVSLRSRKNNGYFTCIPIFQTKSYRENQHNFIFHFFFFCRKSCRLWDSV